MKKIICILLLFATSAVVHSASFSLENKSGKSEEKPVSSAAVYKNIIATGYGLNEEQARANAFKSAIEQYIGVVVDSEAHMKNGDLIKESVLTASNGFIQEYKQLSSKNNGGLFEVTVNAVVKSQKVIEKIKSLNIAVMEIKGAKNIQARVATKVIAKKDAEKMLKKAIEPMFKADFIASMMNIKIDKVDIAEEKEKDGQVPISINYTLSVNYDVYKNKVAELEKLFKNLGAKLYKRSDFPYIGHGRLRVKNKSKVESLGKKVSFGFVKKNGAGYRLDVWVFPDAWKDIYPFNYKGGLRLFDVLSIIGIVRGENVLWGDDITPQDGSSSIDVLSFSPIGYDYGVSWGDGSGLQVVSPLMRWYFSAGYISRVKYEVVYEFMMSYEDIGKIKSIDVEIESKELDLDDF